MEPKDHETLKSLLASGRKNMVIATHKNPDGDAVGSSLGLRKILCNAGHNVQVITPNDYPGFLKWLPDNKTVWRYEWAKNKSARAIASADLIFCLDFNDLSRLEDLGEEIRKSPAPLVMVDHHIAPVIETPYTISDTDAVATSELVYDFSERMGWLPYLDKDAAICLYTGILTDSGQFAFPKTSARTHRIVADLLEKGVDHYDVYRRIFLCFSPSRILLLGKALSNVHFYPDCGAVCMTLSQDELDAAGFRKGDTEGFVNYGLTLKDVNVSCIFVENRGEGIIKVSLRSKGRFSVNEMARRYFYGGGHLNAAGGQLPYTDIGAAVGLFEMAAQAHRKEILASADELQ